MREQEGPKSLTNDGKTMPSAKMKKEGEIEKGFGKGVKDRHLKT